MIIVYFDESKTKINEKKITTYITENLEHANDVKSVLVWGITSFTLHFKKIFLYIVCLKSN